MSDPRTDSPDEKLLPMPGSGEPAGEYMEVDVGDDIVVESTEDGNAPELGEPDETKPANPEFYDNLAELIPPQVLDRITSDLRTKIDEDKQARQKRDKDYEEGIRRTGLAKDAPGGADFEGASKVVHPMITEACIDYESRVIKELFPPAGPVKPKILGEVTQQKVDRAARKVDYMNWQLTTQIKEAFSTLETTLTQVPLGGCQYIKIWQDHRLKRPRMEFIPVDRVYLPFAATSFHSATRRTISEEMTNIEFQQRVDAGQYIDVEMPTAASMPDKSKAEEASDKIEGKEDTSTNVDQVREIWEVMTYLEVTPEMAEILEHEEAGDLYPYLISMEATTGKCIALYRDWEEKDETREPIEHVFEFPFIPWRGAMSIGFPHIIGGLSAAATGALRALLDSAHIQNIPSGAILKGSGVGGQTRRPNPGEFIEIDGGVETQDIRQKIMPFTFQPTSSALFQLLGFVVEAAKGTVRTSLDETAGVDSNSPVPVGTQLSRVEEGMVVFSAIHGRVHRAFNRLLAGLHRLNGLYLPDRVRAELDGREIVVFKRDFQGTPDIQPVSDPTIYSDAQRMNQIGAIQQRATVSPGLYKMREVEMRFLKLMKIEDPEKLLVDQPQPHELNAVNENIAMVMGRPVQAFPDQDHLAHLQVLLDFMKSPVLGGHPLIAQSFLPHALTHAREHIAMFYLSHLVDVVTKGAGLSSDQLSSNDTEVKQALDKLFAQASQQVVPQVEQTLQGILPVLQQAMQTMQQMMPKPPMDPATAAVQAAAAETARKAQADQTGAAHDTAELQSTSTLQAQKNAIDASRVQAQKDIASAADTTKLQQTSIDANTAMDIADMKISSGQGTGLKNGESFTGS